MAFKRLSLRGFSKDYDIRRRVEDFNSSYGCSAALYRGRHLRRKVDEISSFVPAMSGVDAAKDLTMAFRDQLIERHSLQAEDEANYQAFLQRESGSNS